MAGKKKTEEVVEKTVEEEKKPEEAPKPKTAKKTKKEAPAPKPTKEKTEESPKEEKIPEAAPEEKKEEAPAEEKPAPKKSRAKKPKKEKPEEEPAPEKDEEVKEAEIPEPVTEEAVEEAAPAEEEEKPKKKTPKKKEEEESAEEKPEEAEVKETKKKTSKKDKVEKEIHKEDLVFGKYNVRDVVVEDPGLALLINLEPAYVPHSSARHANKPFSKSKISIVERLINGMMRTERFTGKKTKSYKVVYDAFEIIERRTKENPIQILVDTGPSRRLDIALRNICTGSVRSSHKNKKTIAECLSGELIAASKGDIQSFAVSKRDEIERVAKSAH
jgi:small subunit ribosomal protein S7